MSDPREAALAWHRKYGTIPVNHLMCVDRKLTSDARPDVVAEIFRMLKETKAAMPPTTDGIDFHPFGVDALRKPLELIIRYSVEQKIIPRAFEGGRAVRRCDAEAGVILNSSRSAARARSAGTR